MAVTLPLHRDPDAIVAIRARARRHGQHLSRTRLGLAHRDIRSLADQLLVDLSWDVAPALGRGIAGGDPAPTTSDPTGNQAIYLRLALIKDLRAVAGGLVVQALACLREADKMAGMAAQVAETRPPDHTKAPYHDGFPQLEARRDLREAWEAKLRREARGEGFGAA